ncbi:hypothetical protein EMEDMD4_90039 [Sinorhizobium medicae]|uniref:Uncharacterized protein n=1 Tax=Sinorhizobium medicae TaxID=110321 RepID=A0A508XBH8_9HYPH|nr:hypothetical protein EMEDMD4_90039 [Sinorhizobium medicae]
MAHRRQDRDQLHRRSLDIALAWPPGRGPLLVAVYTGEAKAPVSDLNPVFAEIGKIAAEIV